MAQLIQGTDITLYTETGAETVSNVLIGEPVFSQPVEGGGHQVTYTLALPKGDTHDWTDRKVGFFGQLWRTIGSPVQGIVENIPLCWNKKIQVRQLRSNGSCTVYEQKSYVRHCFAGVFISDRRGTSTHKAGDQADGEMTVRIYGICGDGYIPRAGDILVPSEINFAFDTETEQKLSESMAQFRASYAGYAVIRSVGTEYSGDDPDIVLTAR